MFGSLETRIHISDVENKTVICFDTGLDPRSFARAKMPQSLTETGFIVHPDGSHEIWKLSGVNEINGTMQIFGHIPFKDAAEGKRLDLLLSQEDSQAALEAVTFWIRAKLILGDKFSSLNPGAAFINQDGRVFFAPENLSNRCLFIEGKEDGLSLQDKYKCPDLTGLGEAVAAAFCAGVMLYTILAKTHPYPAAEIYQDMREGIFMPVHLAIPNLNKQLSGLIQAALMLPVKKKPSSENTNMLGGTEILGELLKILTDKESLFRALTEEENAQIKKEKEQYLLKKKTVENTVRYVMRNKLLLGGIAAALLFVIFFTGSLIKSSLERPTTKELNSHAVVAAYYEAFNSLDHTFMEACLMGANKSDISTVTNFFVISNVRRFYEPMADDLLIPMEIWIQQGGELPAPNVFGTTDLTITHIGGSETENQIYYRADYLFFMPNELPINRSDILTLKLDRRNNWRITEILRSSN